MRAANAFHQPFARDIFQEIAFRTGLYSAINVFVTIECGENDDPGFLVGRANRFDHVDTIELGHTEIEQRHIWAMLLPEVDGFAAVAGFSDPRRVGLISL